MRMKQRLQAVGWFSGCLLGALALMLGGGCEGSSNQDASGAEQYFVNHPYSADPRSDPVPPTLDVEPASFVVSFINQEVAFTVSGGYGAYHWEVSNPGNGAVNSRGANQAVYIVWQVAENSITVQDDEGHYAVAYIATTSSTGAVVMVVSPASVTLSSGQRFASFTVSGGTAPYTWTSGNVQLGTVAYSAGASYVASYSAVSGAYGQNVITVKDAEDRLASATITQTQ